MQDHPTTAPLPAAPPTSRGHESPRSALSWAAVFAGAIIGAALSAMLVIGGAGLGLLVASPDDMDGTVLAVGTIVWLLLTQVFAYGIAGYVTGRLRTRWTDAAADEIYFRDTAHGFLAWALSVVIGLVLAGSAVTSMLPGMTQAGTHLVGGAQVEAHAQTSPHHAMGYSADALLRSDETEPVAPQVREEIARILGHSVMHDGLADEDRAYLLNVIVQHTDIDESTAEQRLTQVEASMESAEEHFRSAADTARETAAAFALWAFVALFVGAFVASLAATWGGRKRDA